MLFRNTLLFFLAFLDKEVVKNYPKLPRAIDFMKMRGANFYYFLRWDGSVARLNKSKLVDTNGALKNLSLIFLKKIGF
jgi:hypothetical protein